MNMIKDRIDKFQIDNISKILDIPKATIYRWLKEDNEDKIKFIKLLIYLEIDPVEYVKGKED